MLPRCRFVNSKLGERFGAERLVAPPTMDLRTAAGCSRSGGARALGCRRRRGVERSLDDGRRRPARGRRHGVSGQGDNNGTHPKREATGREPRSPAHTDGDAATSKLHNVRRQSCQPHRAGFDDKDRSCRRAQAAGDRKNRDCHARPDHRHDSHRHAATGSHGDGYADRSRNAGTSRARATSDRDGHPDADRYAGGNHRHRDHLQRALSRFRLQQLARRVA
jgi:hypothetical protein